MKRSIGSDRFDPAEDCEAEEEPHERANYEHVVDRPLPN